MMNNGHIDSEDLALYAMQLLGGDEAAQAEAHLRECSACREDLMLAQDDLALVAMTVEQVAPSPAARERFTRQVSREKRMIAMPSAERNVIPMAAPPQKQGGKVLPWLGWAVAAGVAFAAVPIYQERVRLETTVSDQSKQLRGETAQMAALSADAAKAKAIMDALTDKNAMHVALNATTAGKALPEGRATYLADRGTLIFQGSNLQPLSDAKTYELWIIPADGTAPVPAGTFKPDARGTASVVMPEIPKGVKAKAFGVTVEPNGGSKAPTLPILMVGT
jgi:anti-sigma-K factor RskA